MKPSLLSMSSDNLAAASKATSLLPTCIENLGVELIGGPQGVSAPRQRLI